MITDDRIRELIALGSENRNLDYKGPFSWPAIGRDEKVKIAKDVLAFANARDGGVMLIGVDDATGQYLGLSDDEFSSFDQTRFNDFVQAYTDPRHTSNVYRRPLDGKKIVVVEVPEFVDVPIICRQEAASTVDPHKLLLRKAAIYKRTDKATSEAIDDADELRELLNRALLRRQDDLMAAMNRIINPHRQEEPLAEVAKYNDEVAQTDDFIRSRIGNELTALASWTVTFVPVKYASDRMSGPNTVQAAVRDSRVTSSGRDFPHLTPENDSNFGRGFQSWFGGTSPVFGQKVEAFRAYMSGLFRWKGSLWEETHPMYRGRNMIAFQGMIFSFTDWFVFAQRFYEPLLKIEDSLHFEFRLDKARDRALFSPHPASRFSFSRYASQENEVVVEGNAGLAELRSDARGLARRHVRRAFEIFNWNDATDPTIAQWQEQISGNL